jgi:predicted component of type VI protein secretion system
VGRRDASDLVLDWDDQVSRLHAVFERVEQDWTVVDDGLSRNGTFVNGERLTGRRRLSDGDTVRFGGTTMTFRSPQAEVHAGTAVASQIPTAVDLSTTQRRVLVALCRPYKDGTAFASPATNQQIAEELFLSVDAVKTHLRVLFAKFGIEQLPQNQKRIRLVERAFYSGLIAERDL